MVRARDLRRNKDPAPATVRVELSKVVRSRCHLIWHLCADPLTNDLHNLYAHKHQSKPMFAKPE